MNSYKKHDDLLGIAYYPSHICSSRTASISNKKQKENQRKFLSNKFSNNKKKLFRNGK